MCPVHEDGVAGPFDRRIAPVRDIAAPETTDPHQASSARPIVAQCHDQVCITCSDQAVEVTVLRLLGDGLAVVDTGAGQEEVSVALVQAGVGDTILVHAREAIAVVGGDPVSADADRSRREW
jgi:hydrogenase expression/formation protein HypC